MHSLKKASLSKITERCLKNKKVEKFPFLFFSGDDELKSTKAFLRKCLQQIFVVRNVSKNNC